MSAVTRAVRAINHETKRAHGFACAECGRQGSTLAVEADGVLSTRCERCLAAPWKVRPGQWDEAARAEAALKDEPPKKGRRKPR